MFLGHDRRYIVALCLASLLFEAGSALAERPSLLNIFRRTDDPTTTATAYELSEEDGPWLILASTFVGEGSRSRAERLVTEIRKEMDLPAFIYREKFDFTGSLGNRNASSRSMRYANQYQYEAYAVLVGEYHSVDSRQINIDLGRIKTAKPKFFQEDDAVAETTDSSTPAETVKAISRKLLKLRPDKSKGPMANAFATRNPMLPEEYFQSPEVDAFVRQLNEGMEFSLLDCKGKYTVVVATFEGLSTIVDGRKEKKFMESRDRMDKFAADASKMVEALRKEDAEAYQFHDRFRSIVTVGSFATLGRELPDGRFEYTPEIRAVVKKYSAFNSAHARVVPGKNGIAANHAAMIPFDVQPMPIAVPRVSKRSLYGARFGMR